MFLDQDCLGVGCLTFHALLGLVGASLLQINIVFFNLIIIVKGTTPCVNHTIPRISKDSA